MLEKWSCTKVTGGGGVQKSFPRTDPKGGKREWFKRVSSIKKRNQSMSTSASIVGLGLTEAIFRMDARMVMP